MHEMGHQLGLGDTYNLGNPDDLMFGDLFTGERMLPANADVIMAQQIAIIQNAAAAEATLPAGVAAPGGTLIVPGTAGDDIFNVAQGGVIVAGGGGADTFVFAATVANTAATHIADYSAAENDVLDIAALLASLPPSPTGDNANLVRVAEDASGSYASLQVDTGDQHWTDIAVLDGVHDGDTVNVVVDPNNPAHVMHAHGELV